MQVAPPGGGPPTRVLPDACVDLIWQRGAGAHLAGPDTGPVLFPLPPGTVLVGARFRPGAGGRALGLALSALRDQRVALDAIDAGMAERLDLDRPDQVLQALGALAAERTRGAPPDPLVTAATRLLAEPGARAATVADRLGVGERQLRRRCDASVGYGPKVLQRVLRLRLVLDRLRRTPGVDLAALAIDAGYADQAHLTTDVRRLTGLTPGQLRAAAADP